MDVHKEKRNAQLRARKLSCGMNSKSVPFLLFGFCSFVFFDRNKRNGTNLFGSQNIFSNGTIQHLNQRKKTLFATFLPKHQTMQVGMQHRIFQDFQRVSCNQKHNSEALERRM
jgi:hypothetical protein